MEGEAPLTGRWADRLERNEYTSRVVKAPAGKEARLSFKRLHFEHGVSLVEIDLETGRHHQIRVQFAHRGLPILGDRRYGSGRPFAEDSIALHARKMEICHPTLRKEMQFIADPAAAWRTYTGTIERVTLRRWQVYRIDDNGNRFAVARDLTEREADALVGNYEDKGHKQAYCKEIQND